MDEIVLQKTASIERCIKRVKEEYEWAGKDFLTSYTHQDAAILNLQRACEQSIDLSNYIVNVKKWGIPSTSRGLMGLRGVCGQSELDWKALTSMGRG